MGLNLKNNKRKKAPETWTASCRVDSILRDRIQNYLLKNKNENINGLLLKALKNFLFKESF